MTDELVLDILDDGCGIEASNARRSGLTNMSWRAQQVHGLAKSRPRPTAVPMFAGRHRLHIAERLGRRMDFRLRFACCDGSL